ncbi:MAG TPA: sortase [Aggregatilineaceae bacterium]|nr:sortase [Aggregatilineaceae bacterium]
MRDKRPVDELSIEELERILVVRKREFRQDFARRTEHRGRIAPMVDVSEPEPVLIPQQHEAAEHLPPVEPPVTYDLTDEIPRFEDDEDEEIKPRPRKAAAPSAPVGPRVKQRQGWDRMLLGVEVLAVLGLVAVLIVGGYYLIDENRAIEELDKRAESIKPPPPPTPTPAPELRVALSDYVLPGGHYSPVENNGVWAFNVDELPSSVRPAAVAQLAAPQAQVVTASSASPVTIDIPKIGAYLSIYEGDDWYTLQKGVGHYANGINPGDTGNMVLTAHNDIYGEPFKRIQELEPGDEVRVQASNGRWYTYVVSDKQVVEPTYTDVLNQTGQPIVTLITCHPYRVDNQRMVVIAELVE